MSQQAPNSNPGEAGPPNADERATALSIVVTMLLVGGIFFFPVLILPVIRDLLFRNGESAELNRVFGLSPAIQGLFAAITGFLLLQRPMLVRPLAAMARSPRMGGVGLLYLGLSLIASGILQYVLYPQTEPVLYLFGGFLVGGPVMTILMYIFRVQA